MDRSALYGSRNLYDQHRDMRLDIDNMSYEVIISLPLRFTLSHYLFSINQNYWHEQELLALGERIGNVSTGLSEDLILKCLTESIYCSSDHFQEEGKCVICLVRTKPVAST